MRILRTLTLLSLCALPVAAAHATTVYNAATDYSTASNPNGVWSYGYGPATTKYTSNSTYASGITYWSAPGTVQPLVGYDSNGVATAGQTFFTSQNELWLHPGNGPIGDPTQVQFTAAASDTYSIDAIFQRADKTNGGGDGVGVAIYLNGNPLLNRTVISSANYLAYVSFFQTLYLNAGDRLNFAVDSNGDYFYDSTGLQLTITQDPVPEPSSVLLVATGLMSAAAAARRRLFA